MRTETRTVRIGENMGPIDWTYDFRAHFNTMGCSDERRDAECEKKKRWLKRVEDDFRAGVPIKVTTDGGSPRCGIYPVIDVGMYDGWPYWRPTPSVLVETHLGSEWYSFGMITDVYPSALGGQSLGQAENRSRAFVMGGR